MRTAFRLAGLILAFQGHSLLAENLIHNASFESFKLDVIASATNRYMTMTDEISLRLATTPPVATSQEDAELAELDGFEEEEAGNMRLVQEPGMAWHGKTSLRSDLKDALPWGVETPYGLHTFSVYARSRGREMIRMTVEDIRGRKGEIRHKQDAACEVGTEWNRCVFTFTTVAGPVIWKLETLGEGTVWFDAVQLESGKAATAFKLHPWEQTPRKELVRKLTLDVPPMLDGLASLAAAGQTTNGSLPLHISAREPSPTGPLPASGGIPIPRGHLFDAKHAAVFDAAGKPLPCQTRALARNNSDGSIQMLLVDVLADRTTEMELRYGPDVVQPEAAALSAEENDDGIAVNTGPLKFQIAKRNFALFENLSWDRNQDGTFDASEQIIERNAKESGSWTADGSGRLHWSSLGPLDSVRIEENGPVRVCIAATGSHQSAEGTVLFRYVIRIHAYVGKPYIRIEHIFSNEQEPFATPMNGAGIRLPLRDDLFSFIQFTENRDEGFQMAAGQEGFIVNGKFRLRAKDYLRDAKRDVRGWTTLSGSNTALTATIREWGWMPPKEFYYKPGTGLDLCVWPRHLNRGLCVPRGMARTHRFWLWFHKPNTSMLERSNTLSFFQEETIVETDPDRYCDSDAFGQLATHDPERLPHFETMLDRPGEGTFGRFPREGEYGWSGRFVTYGDDRGDMGFGNMETMGDHSMFLMYVRSLKRWYYRRAFDAVVHYRDVDMCHPWGQCRVHSHNHTLMPWDGSHSWIKGVLDHYMLTGDERSLEVANEHGRWLRSKPLDYEVKKGTRRFTRILENLADLYRVTGHPEYLENFSARIEVAENLRGDRKDISPYQLGNLYREEPRTSWGSNGFPHHYAIEGLMQMAKSTGDQKWKDRFLTEMKFVFTDKPGEPGPPPTSAAARAWGAARGRVMVETDTRNRVILPCLNYLHELTGDLKPIEAGQYASIYATLDERWKEGWPNQNWAGHVWFAHSLFYPVKEGMTREDEEAIRSETLNEVVSTELVDAGFEDPKGYSSWASGNERTNAGRVYDIVKDSQLKVDGQRSLKISEIDTLDRISRKKAYDYPPAFTRQKVLLTQPGIYEFVGYLRYRKHGRPDISLVLDGESGKRIEMPFNLLPLLPDRQYDDIEKPPDDSKEALRKDGEEEVIDAVVEFEGPVKKPHPEKHWWQFRYSFEVHEPSTLRIRLFYRFGLRVPGTIWFDAFELKRLEDSKDIGKVSLKLRTDLK